MSTKIDRPLGTDSVRIFQINHQEVNLSKTLTDTFSRGVLERFVITSEKCRHHKG